MKKRILEDIEYTFNAKAKQITFAEDVDLKDLLLATNVTANIIIYNFACEDVGGTLSGKVLTVDYDTSSMNDSDTLQIVISVDQTKEEAVNQQYLNEVRKNTQVLHNIAGLLVHQNELIKQVF